jgi:UDP-2,4-diacetamido-2,4,6-trideoxy-beta-L-altropyranose hydrolase
MPAQVVIRADGGQSLGLGHLRRCVALGKALREDGYHVAFVRATRQDGLVGMSEPFRTLWLEDSPAEAITVDGQELVDAESTLLALGPSITDTAWAVVDHYALGSVWERRVAREGPRIVAIDDFRDRRHSADVLVSDSSQAFVHGAAGPSMQLVGPQYALLDDEFAFEAGDRLPGEALRVLVTFGGSDPTGETSKVLEALRDLRSLHPDREPLDVHVVVGAANAATERIRTAADALPWVTVHAAPPSLAPLIKGADLVITSGGNTMVEALSLRTPCLVIVTFANQQLLVDELRRRDVVTIAGWHASTRAEDIGTTLRAMFAGLPSLTLQLQNTVMFDHLGARRVSQVLRTMDAERQAHHPSRDTGTPA